MVSFRKAVRGGACEFFFGNRLSPNERDIRDRPREQPRITPNPELTEAALERIDREAKLRRSAANQRVATRSWSGNLITENHVLPTYANKVNAYTYNFIQIFAKPNYAKIFVE